MSRLRVHLAHRLVGDFDPDHRAEIRVGRLLILDPGGWVVRVYGPAEWHGAGLDLACAFMLPDDNCPNCSPAE